MSASNGVVVKANDATVCVFNLGRETDEDDVTAFVSQVAPVAHTELIRDRNTGKTRGLAYVELVNASDVSAVFQLTNQILKGRPFMVRMAQANARAQRAQMPPQPMPHQHMPHPTHSLPHPPAPYAPQGGQPPVPYGAQPGGVMGDARKLDSLNEKGNSGVISSTKSRASLMSALAASKGIQLTDLTEGMSSASSGKDDTNGQSGAAAAAVPPSPCLKLANMFEGGDDLDPEFVKELQEDVESELGEHGKIHHSFIDTHGGLVYIKLDSVQAGTAARGVVHNREFDGHRVQAIYVDPIVYDTKFGLSA